MSNEATVIDFDSARESREIVKADISNGFDRLAHELTNALANPPVKLSAREYQIILAVIGKTFRFQKSFDWISNSQLVAVTGISKSHICELKKGLICKKVIIEDGPNIGINPVISEWSEFPKTGTKVPKNGNPKSSQKREPKFPKTGTVVPKNGNLSSQKREPHKKTTTTKETITKKIKGVSDISLPDFLPEKNWLDFVEHRIFIKKPMSPKAAELVMNKIHEFHNEGLNVVECLNEAIERNWQSIFRPTKPKAATMRATENFSKRDYGQSTVSFAE